MRNTEYLKMANHERMKNRLGGVNLMMQKMGDKAYTREQIASLVGISMCMAWDWLKILLKANKAVKFRNRGETWLNYRVTDNTPFPDSTNFERQLRSARTKKPRLPDFDKPLLAWMGYATRKPRKGKRINDEYYETAQDGNFRQMSGISCHPVKTGIQSAFHSAYGM